MDNFEDIFYAYKDLVWSIINRKRIPRGDADDVFMKTWHSVLKSLDSYRGEAKLQSWIGTIAYRRCADYWRSRPQRGEMVYLDDDEYPFIPGPEAAVSVTAREKLISTETVDLVREIMEELDEERRFALEKRIEGFSYREIAEMASEEGDKNVDVNRVGKKIYQARKLILARLEERGIIESGGEGE